jgi:hypothetical protein
MTTKARLLDKSFKYVPAAETDIRATFKRIRREMAAAKKAAPANVKPLKRKEAK